MQWLTPLFFGSCIGASIAMICGPNTLLNLRRTIVYGRMPGIISASGGVCGMAVHAFCAALLGTSLLTILEENSWCIRLVVGVFLCCMGTWITCSNIDISTANIAPKKSSQLFVSMFLLEVTSVLGLSLFVSVMISMNVLRLMLTPLHAFSFALGVVLSVLPMWCAVTWLLATLRSRLPATLFKVLNFISGGLIVVFGVMNLMKMF